MRMSRKERIKEIVKCGTDPVYFLNTYAKIQHPVKGLVPFENSKEVLLFTLIVAS